MPTLATNTPEVAYLMERDWRLRRLIEAVGNLSYEVSGSAYEHVAHSVIEQMLSMKVGRTIEGRLRELCGGEITGETVLSLSLEEIRSCGVAARKAATLQKLARTTSEQRLRTLSKLSDDDVRTALTAVHDIGKRTARYVPNLLSRAPGRTAREDGAVRQVFKWLYGAPITDENVRVVICSLWQPYSSTAVRYI